MEKTCGVSSVKCELMSICIMVVGETKNLSNKDRLDSFHCGVVITNDITCTCLI
jgi:hypothetical protein